MDAVAGTARRDWRKPCAPTGEGLPHALLNRLVVVPFYPINKEMLRTIIKMNLSRVENLLRWRGRSTNQSSAFLPLSIGVALCGRNEPGLMPSVLLNSGRIGVIGSQPLLEALTDLPVGARRLMLYGRQQVPYRVEKSQEPFNPDAWQLWRSLTLSNLFESMDASDSTNAPMIFYCARE